MKGNLPRLRMFAGPNGSGKSTLKSILPPELLGVYVNPDEIEKEIRERNDLLDLEAYGVHTSAPEVRTFFQDSTLLEKAEFLDQAAELRFGDGKLDFFAVSVNAYFAAVAADFIRQKLLETVTTFTFETVMSSPDKIGLLRKAQQRGYRTYLYFVATDDPAVNVSRVRYRVRMGGHPVPEDKIVSRYHRSLALLMDAVRCTHRAYIFDNTGAERLWLAEVTDGERLEMRTDCMPQWFKLALWDKFMKQRTEEEA